MNFVDVFFLAFAFLTIVSALMVVISKNPIQSALYLVLAFFGSSGLWIMAKAEFLGLILILVYVGAVMTLFLFVVMTVNFKIHVVKNRFTECLLALVLVAILLIALAKAINVEHYQAIVQPGQALDGSNTHALGSVLYTDYVYPFEIAGVLLLVAIIAAITLKGKALHRNRKVLNPAEQIRVEAKDRLKIVKMAAVQKPLTPSTPSET
jgi:NADH-quinone oxidoreductase subunit J